MGFEQHPFQLHPLTVNFRMLEHPSKVLAEDLEFFNSKSRDNNKNKLDIRTFFIHSVFGKIKTFYWVDFCVFICNVILFRIQGPLFEIRYLGCSYDIIQNVSKPCL